MSGHFYELPSVFPAAGTTFPIQSMYSLLPSSMEVVMTSHTSYGWFSENWDAIYTCSIHYQMLLLSYFSQTLSAPPPGLFLFWSSSEPRNHFLSSPPTRTHSWSLTRENWYFQNYPQFSSAAHLEWCWHKPRVCWTPARPQSAWPRRCWAPSRRPWRSPRAACWPRPSLSPSTAWTSSHSAPGSKPGAGSVASTPAGSRLSTHFLADTFRGHHWHWVHNVLSAWE